MVGRMRDKRREGAGGLGVDRGRLMIHGARGELDAIPGHEVRGHEFGERLQRATSQVSLPSALQRSIARTP